MSTISESGIHDELIDVDIDEQQSIAEEPTDQPESLESLEVRRDAPLSLVVGGSGGVLAVAFLLRGVASGSPLDWALFVLTGVVAAMHLTAVVDARAPLLVLDSLGVRARRGAEWQGVAWSDVDRVEHLPRRTTLRDGSLTVVTTDERRLGVRLSLSTRLVGADWHEVDEALVELSGATVPVVGRPAETGDGPVTETGADEDAVLLDEVSLTEETATVVCAGDDMTDVMDAPVLDERSRHEQSDAVSPLREARPALRGEVVLDRTTRESSLDPDGEETELPVAAQTQTIILSGLHDDSSGDPRPGSETVEPVVGRQLTAARERIGISIESLAERTRIRPHVIEAIERDDFDSCGGDFYARGHLRTLSRVLGVDAADLLAIYDERYAHAPIDARRVFEAELATTPSGSQGSRGLNWSVLVAAVMAVVLVWSVARLVMDGPVPLSDQPVLNGSPGGKASLSGATVQVPVTLTAATGGARVIVRDGRQQVVFDAQLAFMQTAELDAAPPVRVSTTDGGLVVSVDGVDEGAMGATGQDAQQTYVP